MFNEIIAITIALFLISSLNITEHPIKNENTKNIEKVQPVVKKIEQTQIKSPYRYVTSKVKNGLFYLEIPKMNVHNFWVQRGIGDEQKQLAVGGSLLSTAPMPNANLKVNQNTVIGAHRTGFGNPFYNINKLNNGDTIEIHNNGKVLTYSVYEHFIGHETRDYEKIIQPTGNNILTLYSCDDGKGGPGELGTEYRYVVRANLIETK